MVPPWQLDEAPAHGEPDPGADQRSAAAGAREGRERVAGRRRAVVAQLHADGAVVLGGLDLDVARAGGERDAQQVHEQARATSSRSARTTGRRGGAHLRAGVLSSPASRRRAASSASSRATSSAAGSVRPAAARSSRSSTKRCARSVPADSPRRASPSSGSRSPRCSSTTR